MNALALPVLLGSLAGSLHCAAMCGPFVAAVAAPGGSARVSAVSQAAYHGGRLLSYLVLGAFAGLVGRALDLAGGAGGVGRISAIVAGALLVSWGGSQLVASSALVRLRRKAPRRPGSLLGAVLVRFQRLQSGARGLALGLSSALVPCGWLYAFVATAGASGDAGSAAVVMFAFWLGTVPALVAASAGLGVVVRRLGRHARTLSASLIVLSGIALLALRVGSEPDASVRGVTAPAEACPLHTR
jgi:hypothetical protein